MCHTAMPAVTAISFIDTFRTLCWAKVQINFVSELFNSIVDSARNNVVHEFLNTDSDKLIFIDSDMVWKPEDLLRLMCISTEYPIVGALYMTKNEGDHKYLGHYDLSDAGGKVAQNEQGLVKMKAIPTGFCIIDRSVFETMKPDVTKYRDRGDREIYRFFKTDRNGQFVGEDFDFFDRWTQQYKGEIWVDPDINPGHLGQKVYRGDVRQALVTYNDTL